MSDDFSLLYNLRDKMAVLESRVQEHIRQDLVGAHPRNGDAEKVLQYLGLGHTQLLAFPGFYLVIVPQPAKDNSHEQTAEKVL
jgi:hypothetical protein